ncbi:MAG: DUF4255 domain-containing protein [Micrococcales bacterium]|nr:DUF4255 domain-containing protein [Micrococcales bacterium]
MVGTAIAYLLKRVNAFDGLKGSQAKRAVKTAQVVFPKSSQDGKDLFPADKISMLLVNVSEEREQRTLDLYRNRSVPGKPNQLTRAMPSIRLTLNVLFVACFDDYTTAWNQLSEVMYGFQSHPVFSADEDSEFPKSMGMLTNEMITLSMADQRDIWSTLRSCQQPAIMYRFRVLTLVPREEQPITKVETVKVLTSHE